MQRNSRIDAGYRIDPVTDFSIFTGFTCLHPQDADRDLDEFLQEEAERHYQDRIAVTYAMTRVDIPDIPLGFATLQNGAIVIDDKESLPMVQGYRYSAFPAVKIGRFGISFDFQGGGLGTLFLRLIKDLMLLENRAGCRFITVDARRDKKNKVDATGFYEVNGFSLLLCRAKTSRYIPMYFDLK